MKTSWRELMHEIEACEKCPLRAGCTRVVPGEGNPAAEVMFIGEGPGADEDRTGRPFVGAAGQLLDKMIAAMGLSREMVYIANVVKCRPPSNRVPEAEEAKCCLPFLRAQVSLIRPKVIVCLGATAAKWCIDENIRITRDRGKMVKKGGVFLMPTYHPAALLRDPAKKREAWHDLQAVMEKLKELHLHEGVLK